MPDPQRFDFDAFDRSQKSGGGSFDFDAFDAATSTPHASGPSFLDRLVTPLTDKISKGAKYYADKLNASATDDSWLSKLKGFGAGALEGAGNLAESMTSPAGIAITVGSLGAGAGEAAGLSTAARAGLRGLEAAGSLGQGAHGVQTMAHAKDAGEGWLGAAEAAGGALGLTSGLRGLHSALEAGAPRPRIAPGATAGDYAAPGPRTRQPYVEQPGAYTDANTPEPVQPVTRAASRVSGPQPARPATIDVEPKNWWTSDEPAGTGPVTAADQVAGIDPRRLMPKSSSGDIVNRTFQFKGRNAFPRGEASPVSTEAMPGAEKLDLGINGSQEHLPYPFGEAVDESAGMSTKDAPRDTPAQIEARMAALPPPKYVAPLPEVPPQSARSGFGELRDELKRMGLLPRDAAEPTFGGGSAESLDPGQPRTPWPGERRVLPREADAPVVPKAIRDLHESLKPKWAKSVADQAGDGIPFTVDPAEDLPSFAKRVQHDPIESLMGAERKVRKGLDREAGFIDPSIAKDLPGMYERAAYGGMLSGGGTQLRNAAGGAGAVVGRGAEDTLSTLFGGPHGNRGGRAIGEYFNPRKAVPRLIQAFRNPPEISGKGLPTGKGVLNIPGRLMHAFDQMGKEALEAAGHTPESAADVMLTGDPRSDIGKGLQSLHAKGGTIGRIMMPFVRTGTNLVERGMERTPGIGILASKLMDPEVHAADIAARQVLGGASAFGGYEYGKKTKKTLPPNLATALGAYGIPAQMAAAFAAARAQKQKMPAAGIAATKAMVQPSPLPTEPWQLNHMFDPEEYAARLVPNALRDVGELIPGVEPSRFDPHSPGVPYPLGKALAKIPGLNRAFLKHQAAKKPAKGK